MMAGSYPLLHRAAFEYPAIDNHAHPLLRESHRSELPFEGLVSEAHGNALKDAPCTIACLRACKELAKLYHEMVSPDAALITTWSALKTHRSQVPYLELCKTNFAAARIERLLLDDGLSGVEQMGESLAWHDQFTKRPTKRIVRIEPIAERILVALMQGPWMDSYTLLEAFKEQLGNELDAQAGHPDVVGFKSVVCYRTGLGVGRDEYTGSALGQIIDAVRKRFLEEKAQSLRLSTKALNDLVVCKAVDIAGERGIPVQFHAGLGDNDLLMARANPSLLQPLIKTSPKTAFVILHAAYPFTREAGYLTSVYLNVYLDFGEIFPMVSRRGQEATLREVFELCPTNKIMWSSDGHWWPESFYLGSHQARVALFNVMKEMVDDGDLSQEEAVTIVHNALNHTAVALYKLKEN